MKQSTELFFSMPIYGDTARISIPIHSIVMGLSGVSSEADYISTANGKSLVISKSLILTLK